MEQTQRQYRFYETCEDETEFGKRLKKKRRDLFGTNNRGSVQSAEQKKKEIQCIQTGVFGSSTMGRKPGNQLRKTEE